MRDSRPGCKPKLADLLGRRGIRHHFADGASVDHAGGEIGTVMDGDRRHGAVLRQGNRRFPVMRARGVAALMTKITALP
jgi:hypothetical protein